MAKGRWVEARTAALLPVPYFPWVFPLPPTLNRVAPGNAQVCDSLLCRAAADTLPTFGRAPQGLGGTLGLTIVLHT